MCYIPGGGIVCSERKRACRYCCGVSVPEFWILEKAGCRLVAAAACRECNINTQHYGELLSWCLAYLNAISILIHVEMSELQIMCVDNKIPHKSSYFLQCKK